MTAPTEKAAPIPADVWALARGEAKNFEQVARQFREYQGDLADDICDAIASAIIQDRVDQEERIREDEKGLRGKIVYPCARFRNDNEFHDPEGYVIVKAERAAASEGRPSPMYYTLVCDTGEVRTLLSTLFTRDADRARQRGDAS